MRFNRYSFSFYLLSRARRRSRYSTYLNNSSFKTGADFIIKTGKTSKKRTVWVLFIFIVSF
jgi:hypothetical protein